MTYGYIYNAQNIESEKIRKEMEEKFDCSKIFSDTEQDEKKRPGWNELTKSIQDGDTLIVFSLDNILMTVMALPFFFRWLTLKDICFVSISDEIDTEGNFFPSKNAKEVFDIIGLLPQKIGKNRRKGYSRKVKAFLPCSNKKAAKKSAAIKIVNMYRSGYSVSEIADAVGYRTRMSVYNVLSRFNIDLRQKRDRCSRKKGYSTRATIASDMFKSGCSIQEITKFQGYANEEEAKTEIIEYL